LYFVARHNLQATDIEAGLRLTPHTRQNHTDIGVHSLISNGEAVAAHTSRSRLKREGNSQKNLDFSRFYQSFFNLHFYNSRVVETKLAFS
jgi:hypothetical protein